jgi:Ca2+-binding RTX toxin-like protein
MARRDGTTGNDVLNGTGFSDEFSAGAGNDFLRGFGGNDTMFAGSGNDNVFGDSGDDVIDGGAGSDMLWGGSGADVIAGGSGNDHMWGGTGADTFFFANNTATGTDRIYDFNPNEDSIALFVGSGGGSAHITSAFDITSGSFDVTIDFEDAGSVVLENISVFDLNAAMNSVDFV